MRKDSLKIKGVLEDQTAVIGNLSHDGVDRPVMIILNTATDDYKRKKAVQVAKEQAQSNYIPLAGDVEKSLTDIFKAQARNDIIGRIHDPHEVHPTLDTILKQTSEGLIILDCYDKPSFWTSLRALDVSNDDLFPIAELEAFKQNGSTRNSKKPIVKAHELLHSLSFPTTFFGVSTLSYLQRVRSAIKVRAPSISLHDQLILASYNRDIQLNRGEGDPLDQKFFSSFKRGTKIGKLLAESFLGLFNRNARNIKVMEVVEKIDSTKVRWQLKYGELPDHKHSIFNTPKMPLKPLSVFEGDVEQAINDYYQEERGIKDLDRITQLEPVLSSELVTLIRSQFRQGNHRPPYDNMLIECQTRSGMGDHNDKPTDYFVLLRLEKDGFGDEDSVNVNIFASTKTKEGIDTHFLHSEEFAFHLNQDGSLKSINSFCRNNEEELTLTMFGMSYLSMVISQTLNVLARMNEPDFVENRVKPPRGVHSFKKGHFPYFEAIDISDFSPASGYLSINPDGKVTHGVSLHPVKRHQRRIFDRDTGALKEVVTVKAHLRGSAAVGVRARTHDFDSK